MAFKRLFSHKHICIGLSKTEKHKNVLNKWILNIIFYTLLVVLYLPNTWQSVLLKETVTGTYSETLKLTETFFSTVHPCICVDYLSNASSSKLTETFPHSKISFDQINVYSTYLKIEKLQTYQMRAQMINKLQRNLQNLHHRK